MGVYRCEWKDNRVWIAGNFMERMIGCVGLIEFIETKKGKEMVIKEME